MLSDLLGAQADRSIDLLKEFSETTASANATTKDALDVARDAVKMLTAARQQAAMLSEYFTRMAIANDHEPVPGNIPYSGPAAFRHAAELLTMLARGEKIL